ncbi:MAG: hypothetical protein MJ198_06455 [Bacteroidales bacterium]|nr:hypothetical protein [Bacteroidales bacterium]
MTRFLFFVFSLFFYCQSIALPTNDNPSEFKKETTFTIQCEKNTKEILNVLHSISTLKGIVYYSNTHEKWDILYREAGFINSPEKQKIIPDTTALSLSNNELFCLLDDNSLGKCIFKVQYTQDQENIIADFILVNSITFMGLEVISPKNLNIRLCVKKDSAESIITTIRIHAKYQKVTFLESWYLPRLDKSFDARLEALKKWFLNQINI